VIEPLCSFTELLDRLALGDASPEERKRLADHVAGGCPTCTPRFEGHARFERLLEGAFQPIETQVESRRRLVLDRLAEEIDREEDRRAWKLMVRRTVRFGFTTIILVTALMLPLAYIGYATLAGRLRAKQLATARVEVRALTLALASYQHETGALPQGDVRALVAALSTARPDHGGRRYFDFDGPRLKDGVALDPFGRPYVYELVDPKRARIRSVGPNGHDDGGSGDDVAQELLIGR
jgi:hypothetical protein